MRKIKFRGWCCNQCKWLYGDLFENMHDDDDYCIQYWDEEDGLMNDRIEYNSIGQFTGIYDINNKEIYEGDVLMQDCFFAVVKWDDKRAAFYLSDGISHQNMFGYESDGGKQKASWEVIGNIFEKRETEAKIQEIKKKQERILQKVKDRFDDLRNLHEYQLP